MTQESGYPVRGASTISIDHLHCSSSSSTLVNFSSIPSTSSSTHNPISLKTFEFVENNQNPYLVIYQTTFFSIGSLKTPPPWSSSRSCTQQELPLTSFDWNEAAWIASDRTDPIWTGFHRCFAVLIGGMAWRCKFEVCRATSNLWWPGSHLIGLIRSGLGSQIQAGDRFAWRRRHFYLVRRGWRNDGVAGFKGCRREIGGVGWGGGERERDR
ncbi:hypothetical protein RchiOBHm_Chr5g0082441 [Rosa chinensis]|uniref:Uncharacterized protein n=1 Tax=Rosa chinensis TaxID=74649 RepID=A0A2P6QNB5_ROSCH|nr:hypothetical protein RchiOBHm_Chr5g0082441 [Rosa chinensis]